MIPLYHAVILLPEEADVKDVKVKSSSPIIQTGFDLPWGQPPCTFSDEPVTVGRNEEIYSSDNLYPNNLYEIVGIETFRGHDILHVDLYPLQYMPKSGTVKFYETMTVEVKFAKGLKNTLHRGSAKDKAAVSGMVDNPEVLTTYEEGATPLTTEEYIIITNSTMESTFQTLATHKANYVNGASVYTVSWIYSNYAGVDNQDKIRNFIIDKYTNNGTLYVLMGGDTAAVPYRGFYVSTGGYTDYDMLADMYFAHLDGTHNADGDSRYGEINDNVDFYAEVAVGRAPVQTVAEATAFVDKVIAYELAAKPERVLLHQSRVGSNNIPDSRCLAWNCDDYIPGGYYIDYLFEEDGTVTKAKWRTAWAAHPVAVAHIGHGNTTLYYINYQVGGTVVWSNADIPSLTNTFWPWTTSVACHSGEIEANDCLAEAYVMDPDNGAIAALYNDNYGWYMSNDACALSGEFCEMEFRACWSDGYEKLGDMLNQSRSYMAPAAQSDTYYRWCFYERNLVGDPESPCLTQRTPVIPPTVTITNPSEGEIVSGIVDITTSTTGCIDTVEFYIDGVLKYTDTSDPFGYSWDTTPYSNGLHTISVRGYCSGVFKDDDAVTVYVDNAPEPYVEITNPEEGEVVSGIVLITTETEGIDTVEFYIDGVLKYTDTSDPFGYSWNTLPYLNGLHTISVRGYYLGEFIDDDAVTVYVNNTSVPYLKITNPEHGETVSGTVLVTTKTEGVKMVVFHLNGEAVYKTDKYPFVWKWDTTKYENGPYELAAVGYYGNEPVAKDAIKVKVENKVSLGVGLLSLLILLLPAKIRRV
jgi:hypothetical protein